jgi:hypothetical protein
MSALHSDGFIAGRTCVIYGKTYNLRPCAVSLLNQLVFVWLFSCVLVITMPCSAAHEAGPKPALKSQVASRGSLLHGR